MKKTLKRALCTILAGTGMVASLTMFSACTTNRPQVEIHISFNGESYTLAYRLYRKLAPSTVQHFIELAENGYYDGLCVHDYQADSRMYTGGYTYDANVSANGGLVEKNYFETVSVLGREGPLARVRHEDTGRVLWTVASRLWQKDGKSHAETTDYALSVEEGDLLRVVYQTPRGLLAQKNGVTGWYYGAWEA